MQNFPVSGQPLPYALITALAQIKEAAALANAETGALPSEIAEAIAEAARQDRRKWIIRAHFPIDVFQTGSGTSTNMNMNEVLARLAGETPRPERARQRSRERVAVEQRRLPVGDPPRGAATCWSSELQPGDAGASSTRWTRKAGEFTQVVKSGRTHLMDATPVTLGQEFSGYAQQVRRAVERVASALPQVARAAAGRHRRRHRRQHERSAFRRAVYRRLAATRACPSRRPRTTSRRTAPGTRWSSSPASSARPRSPLQDRQRLRWMGSGPRAGLRELQHPRPAAGLVDHAGQGQSGHLRVGAPGLRPGHRQRAAVVAFAGSQGDFELNVMLPGHGPQPAGVDHPAGRVGGLLAERCVAGTAGQRGGVPRLRRGLAVAS